MLNLLIQWEHGQLGWQDPETGEHIATFAQERVRAESAETRAEAAEARVRELEAELERHHLVRPENYQVDNQVATNCPPRILQRWRS